VAPDRTERTGSSTVCGAHLEWRSGRTLGSF
jgi:hypothetical protein